MAVGGQSEVDGRCGKDQRLESMLSDPPYNLLPSAHNVSGAGPFLMAIQKFGRDLLSSCSVQNCTFSTGLPAANCLIAHSPSFRPIASL